MRHRHPLMVRWSVALLLAASSCSPCVADHWMVSPQFCRGKAWSHTAKDAAWMYDAAARITLATPESGVMLTSVCPKQSSNFVIHLRVHLESGSQCRLTLGDITFEITSEEKLTRLTAFEESKAVRTTESPSQEWTLVTVRRRDNIMSATLGDDSEIDLGTSTAAFDRIGLSTTRGTIAVSNFVVAGDVERCSEPDRNTGLKQGPEAK